MVPRKTWAIVMAVVAAAWLLPGAVQAAVDAVRIQDGDGASKVQVDNGSLRVKGKTTSSDAELLAYGDCESSNNERSDNGSLPAGTTITEIVLTNDVGGTSRSTLVVKKPSVPGFDPGTGTPTQQRAGRFMALQVGFQSGGYSDFNESIDFGDGVLLDEAWYFFCGGVIGASQGDALWSVYGYSA